MFNFLVGYRTYLSLILASLAMWAPTLGLDFTAEDATAVEESIVEAASTADTAVTQVLMLAAGFFAWLKDQRNK